MKTLLLAALLALGLTACDSIVQQTPHPERAFIEKSTQGCSTGPGYCYECGLGFNGKYECSFGMKYSCSGSQPVTLRVTPWTNKYESGKVTQTTTYETLSVDGECS